MTRKINYFLATWAGPRQGIRNPDDYLRTHIEKLDQLQHGLSQISIGCPDCPQMSKKYRNFVDSLKTLSDGTPIVVHDMPNSGLSYGQYSRLFEKYRDQFSHYILMEDDYVPVLDNFDTILADIFDQYQTRQCGYLCGTVLERGGRFQRPTKFPKHAGVSNGIVSNKSLSKVWDEFGCLPHKGQLEQLAFSQAFIDVGEDILDITESGYRCVYRTRSQDIWAFGEGADLMVPIQFLQQDNPKILQINPAIPVGSHPNQENHQ